MIAAVALLFGGFIVLTAYGNPVVVPDIPLITTRGDVSIQQSKLQQQVLAMQTALAGDAAAARRAQPAAEAARLLTMQPLSSNALLFAQFDRRFARNERARDALTHAALKADPRSRGAHAAQFMIAVRRRQFSDAVTALERLINVEPTDTETVVPLLALLTNDNEARQVLLGRLRQPRPWHAQLASRLADTRMPVEQLVAFGTVLVRHPDPNARQAILSGLINRGAYREAYRLWSQSSPSAQRSGNALVRGPRFAPDSLAYPFGWTLHQEGSDGADLADPHGLLVRYSGRNALTFASQTLVLPAGRYRLVVSGLEGNFTASGLVWSVACRPDNSIAGSIDLGAVTPSAGRLSTDFAIGAGCSAQQLSLTIARAEFPENREMQIGAVDIRPIP